MTANKSASVNMLAERFETAPAWLKALALAAETHIPEGTVGRVELNIFGRTIANINFLQSFK